MNIDGWMIDDSLLPLPSCAHLPHRLFESPTGKFAVVMYDRREILMGVEIARLAVFKTKSTPRLILKQPDVWWDAPLTSPVTWISDAAFAAVTNVTIERCDLPFVVIDLDRRQFCFIHVPRGDMYRIRAEEGVVSLCAKYDGDVSADWWRQSYAKLHWFSFERLYDFLTAYEESAAHSGVPRRSVRQRIWAAMKNALGFPM